MKELYNIWKCMRQRCTNPSNPSYKRYGGRGIKICQRWDSYQNFYNDMAPRPSVKHSIERKNNDLGYSPENCKWATAKEQAINRRKQAIPSKARGGEVKKCTECNNLIYVHPCLLARKKYCSDVCRFKSMRNERPNRRTGEDATCLICKNTFYSKRYKVGKFCSVPCYHEAQKTMYFQNRKNGVFSKSEQGKEIVCL